MIELSEINVNDLRFLTAKIGAYIELKALITQADFLSDSALSAEWDKLEAKLIKEIQDALKAKNK